MSNGYCEYFIIMPDEDTFILKIHENINRPNNPDNDEIIQEYMLNNYGTSTLYEVIDKDNGRFDTINIL